MYLCVYVCMYVCMYVMRIHMYRMHVLGSATKASDFQQLGSNFGSPFKETSI